MICLVDDENVIDSFDCLPAAEIWSMERLALKGHGEWCNFSYPWASMMYSRLGFGDAAHFMLDIWRKMYLNESFNPVCHPVIAGFNGLHYQHSKQSAE